MIKAPDLQYLKHFFQYAEKFKVTAIIGIAMLPVSVATNLLFPWLIIQIIDVHLVNANLNGMWQLIGLMVLVLIVNYLADSIYSYCLRKTGQYTVFEIRRALFNRILHLPRGYFDKTPNGVTLSRLTSDLEAIGESFVLGVIGLVKDSINTIALVVMMFFIDPQLTMVILIVFPPVLYLTAYVRNKLRAMYQITRSSLAKGTGFLQEALMGIKTVQLYQAEDEVENKYRGFTNEFLNAQLKTNKYDALLFSVISGVTTITIGFIIWYGSGKVIQEVLTLGVLIAFINTLEKVFVPIRDFTSQIASIQRSFAAFDHVEELFVEPLAEQNLTLMSSKEVRPILERFQSLEFINVSFRYKAGAPYVLKDVSFVLNKGHQLALVGTTGSGKSTILRLISKTYQDYEGSILLNGIELSSISIENSARLFSLMQQDVFLFEETIEFNISLGKPKIDLDDVIRAANYVYANQFIDLIPEGYQMQLNSNGSNLSAGQTQLISFARAVAQGGQVMMLDEATSSVDSVTESLIQKAIGRLFNERTVIAIAHRLSTIRHSDMILVLDQGSIIERGNHDELVSLNDVYSNLLNETVNEDNDFVMAS